MHLLNGMKRIEINWRTTLDNHQCWKTASNGIMTQENSSINETVVYTGI